MGDTSIEAPEPSAEEKELSRIQIGQIRDQEAEQRALRPFQLEALGLIEDISEDDRARLTDLQSQLSRLQSGDQNVFAQVAGADLAGKRKSIQDEISSITSGALRRLTEEERVSGLSPSQRRQENIRTATEERQLLALEGDLPISEGFSQQKQSEFEKLKESLAQRGIEVSGDTPEDATSSSSPGIQALRQFKERFALVEDAQRRGEISQGTGNLLAIQSGITGVRQTQLQNQIAFPQRRAGFLSSVGQAFQPFQFNRSQQFGANQQNAANQAQLTSDIFGLAGVGGGVATAKFLQ